MIYLPSILDQATIFVSSNLEIVTTFKPVPYRQLTWPRLFVDVFGFINYRAQWFVIMSCAFCPQTVFVFCVMLTINDDYFPKLH
jgi:hypothetical protein